uniref:Methyltransferase domain-containing protein n=1 Tax=Candidatus Kentrum sp. LFY TaxID=2126342 RepID=A0A450UGJ4_9GAMM|nr:MAG: hypothetical protein BECKLFY1418B_GA0070995_102715 [Candidatus Kentron sp. LFY]
MIETVQSQLDHVHDMFANAYIPETIAISCCVDVICGTRNRSGSPGLLGASWGRSSQGRLSDYVVRYQIPNKMDNKEKHLDRLFSWEGTFSQFDGSCNESERVAEHFRLTILFYLAELEEIKWLDIGCGDGHKTALLAKHITSKENIRRLSLADPKLFELGNIVKSNISAYSHFIEETNWLSSTIEELNSSLRDKQEYNFFTLIHCVHTLTAFEALIDLLKNQFAQGGRKIFYIVNESEESDIYIIRRILEEHGFSVPKTFTDNILSEVFGLQARICSEHIGSQYFDIDINMLKNDDYWLFPFLLGESSISYASRHSSERNNVANLVRNYIGKKSSSTLLVPDRSVLCTSII